MIQEHLETVSDLIQRKEILKKSKKKEKYFFADISK